MQRRHIRMLDLRRRARLAQEAIMRVLTFGDLRPDHLDHARGAEECVRDFVDLAHASDAEALDNLVLAINGLIRVAAQEVCDRFAAVWARFVGAIDLCFAADAVECSHEGADTS